MQPPPLLHRSHTYTHLPSLPILLSTRFAVGHCCFLAPCLRLCCLRFSCNRTTAGKKSARRAESSSILPPTVQSREKQKFTNSMSFYEPQGWQAPQRQASWEQPAPPSRSGTSSAAQRDETNAFASQYEGSWSNTYQRQQALTRTLQKSTESLTIW